MKKVINILTIFILCFFLSACTSKLITIRPTLITRMEVENIITGKKAEHTRKKHEEIDWLMDDLIFQMEQQYKHIGKCVETDTHIYYAKFYMKDTLELNVYINNDGSVCKNNKRYFLFNQSDKKDDGPTDLDKWEEFLNIGNN